MIIDLEKFMRMERPYWDELDGVLKSLDKQSMRRMDIQEAKRFHYLYERVSSDLAKLSSFAAERETRGYLEALVARAYGEIHETRERPHRVRPVNWLINTLPQTFRRHVRSFQLSLAVTMVGCVFGGAAVGFDWSAKDVLMPFPHLVMDPRERVAQEEKAKVDHVRHYGSSMTAFYITNNSKVSFLTAASGAMWGVGTLLLLFSNGVMLGAVAIDYVLAGQTKFLVAWLLPHGALEIPAILIAGQAGFILAGAIIGWGVRVPFRRRLRLISKDLVTLIMGVVVMLIWAGFVEAWLSQYHEPVIPYAFKIVFGAIELVLLSVFLAMAGRKGENAPGKVRENS